MPKMKRSIVLFSFALFFSCWRGKPEERPPIHLVRDMDSQPKYRAQSSSPFFNDGSAMREPIPGTVRQNELYADSIYYYGIDPRGKPVQSPIPRTAASRLQGGQNYVFCSPCHGPRGDGQGVIIPYGFTPPPSFFQDHLIKMTDGEIFVAISNGIRNMPSHKSQLSVLDRWLIVHHLRVWQDSVRALSKGRSEISPPSIK